MSHVWQSNKNKTYRGRCNHLPVSIVNTSTSRLINAWLWLYTKQPPLTIPPACSSQTEFSPYRGELLKPVASDITLLSFFQGICHSKGHGCSLRCQWRPRPPSGRGATQDGRRTRLQRDGREGAKLSDLHQQNNSR